MRAAAATSPAVSSSDFAIARALATKPKVLLLTNHRKASAIDHSRTASTLDIRDERGLGIVASEQLLSFAVDIADRVIVLEGGTIVHEDARADIDQEKVARYLAV